MAFIMSRSQQRNFPNLKEQSLRISYGDLAVTFVLFFVSFGALLSGQTDARSVQVPSASQVDVGKYLSTFGYLPKGNLELGGSLTSAEDYRDALVSFQRMANLRVTGELDTQTIIKMEEPRCGMQDHAYGSGRTRRVKRYNLGPSYWDTTDLTYSFDSFTRDLSQYQTRDAISRAFDLWSDVSQLKFFEVASGGDMRISFGRGYHGDGYNFDGPGSTLAHAFYPGTGEGGDLHFDEDEMWTVREQHGVNLYIAAAHEMGHALGLAHSDVSGSLMYPWYQGYQENYVLPDDDVRAIQSLYGRNTDYNPVHPTVRPVPPTDPPYRPRPTNPPVRPTDAWTPESCPADLDAVALIRQETFMFKGMWFWRLDRDGQLMHGYPVEFHRFWEALPSDVRHIDAAYQRSDDRIVFFSGNRYWVYRNNDRRRDSRCPREGCSLTDFGLPSSIERVDAAFIWDYNGQTYLITEDIYWKYDETSRRLDPDYPRDMDMWQGVPVPVQAAFTAADKHTYFFQGPYFYKFANTVMKVEDGYPKYIGPSWLGCEHQLGSSAVVSRFSLQTGVATAFLFSLIGFFNS